MAREGSAAYEAVVSSLMRCKATNMMSELRFARTTQHMMSSKYGPAASISSMASKHALAELSSLHGHAVVKWEKEDR